ncbi:hypothetical protein B0H66DRAFT_603012 [Apodospora peruviana]|uniref:Uncharacterized protein n=1 Tax=Apodospora peruviana TaxID=516989 RepID=A0AAE0M5B4_9PEZI|nr:hypothetical protein B0H66DRAFT_603012 [Apodospora peruviana]
MLKAVRRTRSHRPEADAVGQLQIHAHDYALAEQPAGQHAAHQSKVEEEEGAHGPTAPYGHEPVIPGPVSGPLQHDADRPSRPSRHGHGHVQIVDIPPVRFPGGKNPYLDRPLPPPPPPKVSTAPNGTNTAVAVTLTVAKPTMPARPSTSSGPDSSRITGLRPNFEKRLSKDDMALTSQPSLGRTKKGMQPFRFGLRNGALPTPEPSPDNMAYSPMPPMMSSIPARVMTPESLSSGEIQIGMALGSPSHASFQAAGWQPQAQSQSQSRPVPQDVYSPSPLQRTPEPPIQRQKTQKRRLFGLFGRKNVEPPKAAEIIEANTSVVSITTSPPIPRWQVDSPPARSNTVIGRMTTKYQPILVRSGTEPYTDNAFLHPAAQKESNSTSGWSNTPPRSPQVSSSPGGPGLLDIEIPDIRLERYSIMFSGVLNQQGAAPASSLLARRQATLEKLKTINDRILDEEEKQKNKYRRATSPQPTKSPAFTLFPSTPVRPPHGTASNLAPRGTPSRMRSNTSPALLPSPSRTSFEPKQNPVVEQQAIRKERKTVTIVSPRTMDERGRAAHVEKLREQQAEAQRPPPLPQQTTGFRFGPEESALILDSPQSMSGDEQDRPITGLDREVVDSFPFKPTLPEPQWQMISTPPNTSIETGSVTTKRTMSSSASSTASSTQTQLTRPPSIDVDEEDADLKAAVEISIARQISISRQQRQLLRPVRSNTVLVGGGQPANVIPTGRGVIRSASSPSSAATIAGLKGRVAETKLAIPKVELAQHRKSERIVLEGV